VLQVVLEIRTLRLSIFTIFIFSIATVSIPEQVVGTGIGQESVGEPGKWERDLT
jgi:hypothetical protein